MRRVERQLRRAYRLAKLGYWYWETGDRQGETGADSQVSDEICEIFGSTRDDLHWDESAAFCERYVHAEDRAMVMQVFLDFDAGAVDNYTISYRLLHPSGEIRHVRSVSERIRDERGRPLYGIGIIQDLTEVKTAEATLRRSEYQLRRAQRVARLYCWHTEEDPQTSAGLCSTTILYRHPAARARTADRKPTGLHRAVCPSRGQGASVADRQRLRARRDRQLLAGIPAAAGGRQHPLYPLAGERDAGCRRHALQLFGAIQDVTDLKQREAELIEAKNEAELANRSKGEFLTNMSHELRTPLNAIIGFSQVIRDQLFGSDPGRYVDYARDINESGLLLLELINDILDVSKLEAGKHVLYEEELLDRRRGRGLHEHHEIPRGRGRGQALGRRLQRAAAVWAEERAMKQVLLNLLSNAVKFTPRNGSVKVQGRLTKDGEIAVAVIDTGIGIAPDVLPHLFAPFRQGDNSISRQFGGSGLGLAISRRLVELHDGRIESKATRQGDRRYRDAARRARDRARPGNSERRRGQDRELRASDGSRRTLTIRPAHPVRR